MKRAAYDDWSSEGEKQAELRLTSRGNQALDLDQEVCLCFHVTRRKIENFIRLEQPKRAAQLSECFGAGTGCGWCRRYLIALFESSEDDGGPKLSEVEIPVAADYAEMRRHYRQKLKETDSESTEPPDN